MAAIALTAYTGEYNQHQALNAGFEHLSKLAAPGKLVQLIATLIKPHQPISFHAINDKQRTVENQEDARLIRRRWRDGRTDAIAQLGTNSFGRDRNLATKLTNCRKHLP